MEVIRAENWFQCHLGCTVHTNLKKLKRTKPTVLSHIIVRISICICDTYNGDAILRKDPRSARACFFYIFSLSGKLCKQQGIVILIILWMGKRIFRTEADWFLFWEVISHAFETWQQLQQSLNSFIFELSPCFEMIELSMQHELALCLCGSWKSIVMHMDVMKIT